MKINRIEQNKWKNSNEHSVCAETHDICPVGCGTLAAHSSAIKADMACAWLGNIMQ
jgi:hypothetical protein